MDNQQQTPEPTSQPTPEPVTPHPQGGADLMAEFSELGKRLTAAVQAALSSEQRYQLEKDVREGLKTLSSEVEETFNKARTTKMGQNVEQTMVKAADTVRTSKVTAEVRDGLAQGLRELNEQLAKLTSNLEKKQTTASVPPTEDTIPPAAVANTPPAPVPPTAELPTDAPPTTKLPPMDLPPAA